MLPVKIQTGILIRRVCHRNRTPIKSIAQFFLLNLFIYSLYNPISALPLLPVPPHISSSTLKGETFFGCQYPLLPSTVPYPVHQVAVGLGTSSPTEARQSCPFRGAGSIGRQVGNRLRIAPAPVAGGPT